MPQAATLPLLVFLASAAMAALSQPAAAQQTAVGKAHRIVNSVSAAAPSGGATVQSASLPSARSYGGERRLSQDDQVNASERISAQTQSFAELLLEDDSKVLVGEGSTVYLDDFVVGSGGLQSATINVAKGAFRFVSGSGRRASYTVKTPLSSIGVRGTIFDVYVGDGGATDVVLLRGGVVVCANNGPCRQAQRACDIVRVPVPGQVEEQPFLGSAERSQAADRQAFGLLDRQQRFSRAWRAPLVACASRAAVQSRSGGNASGNDGFGGGAGFGGGQGGRD